MHRIRSLLLIFAAVAASAQTRIHGHVMDAADRPVPGATVTATGPAGELHTSSDAAGAFTLNYASPAFTLRAFTPTMESAAMAMTQGESVADVTLILKPSAANQQITVTVTRSSIAMGETANTVYALSASDLAQYPATTLDDKLRQQAGFDLFRRASSRVANPTSEGISLRGLGSTAVSRSLVLEDGVPMLDPFGGWVHWDEIPAEALDAVTVATGGGSDLYGSSALGGVIDVVTAHPRSQVAEISAIGGSEYTSSESARLDESTATLGQLLAADLYRTNGYIVTAPSVAGPDGLPADVHSQAGRSETDYISPVTGRLFLTGNVLNEARNNGTPLQTNATRLWRYIAGDDWSASGKLNGRVRLFGTEEGYRQSFSSINGPRTIETLSSLQHVRAQEVGGSTDATLALAHIAFVAGFDLRDIRGTDDEQKVSNGLFTTLADTSARERFIGGFAEALGSYSKWSAALSLRADSVANFDTKVVTLPTSAIPVPVPDRGEDVVSPRLGVTRQVGGITVLHASVFRAFRGPTMNELYRTGQIGAQITQANSELLSERATGWEIGVRSASHGGLVAVGATYFWTEINRPVSAVLLSTNLYRRENLGQIRSQGTELHLDLKPLKYITLTAGYEYANAVVTKFSAQPTLVGNWIPEVPRNSFTAQVRAEKRRIGSVTLAARAVGHTFDDSANQFYLTGFYSIDLSAEHSFGAHWTATGYVENLTNQRAQVSETPTLTLGVPIFAQAGLAYHWAR